MRIALAQMNPTVGDLVANRQKIIYNIQEAKKQKADLIVFPELALCGYPPKDLLLLPDFIDAMEQEIKKISKECYGISALVGLARTNPQGEKRLFNSACLIEKGAIRGFQDKILLPNYDVFSEKRYFDAGSVMKTWTILGKEILITICEDIWARSTSLEEITYKDDPIKGVEGKKIDLVINLSASPFFSGGIERREAVVAKIAAALHAPTLLVNQVGGNDGLLFDGHSLVMNAHGEWLAQAVGFAEELLIWEESTPPLKKRPQEPMHILFEALVMGTRDYFQKTGFHQAILGLSGGIDSAVTAAIVVQALGKENVHAFFMPSRFTSKESKEDAYEQAARLGIALTEISIEMPFQAYLELLAPLLAMKKEGDITEENMQARIRGMILMAYSNKRGALVISTGNKSELAVGYATLYGDMCGGLQILGDVTKREVYALAHWLQDKIVARSIRKSPSAELREGQQDSDTLPPYEILDQIIESYVHHHHAPKKIAEKEGIPLSLVQEIVKKIHLNEYKRQQAAPLLRVTKKSLTEGRFFPIAQRWNI